MACVAWAFASSASIFELAGAEDLASLSIDELMMMEVTTPGKFPEPIRDSPSSVYLVSRSDIEAFGYSSLTEILESVPGLYNIDNYEGASGNFGFRGFWNPRSQNSNVAILVNGIPQARMDLRSHPMEFLTMPVEAIDKIEVARGPNSVIYGNGASFGAINIITDESYHADQLTVAYGANNRKRAAARWSAFSPDSHLIVNAGATRDDGLGPRYVDLMSPEQLQTLPSFNITDPEASLDGQLERRNRHLQVAGAWREFYFDYSYSRAKTEFLTGVPPVADGNQRDSRTSRITVGYQADFASDWHWNTWASYNDFDIDQSIDALFPDFESDYWLEYNSWEAESTISYEQDDRFRLLLGVNWQRMEDLYEYTYVPLYGLNNEVVKIDEREMYSLFGQASYRFSSRWRVVAGLRSERVRRYLREGYTNILTDSVPAFGGIEGGVRNLTPRGAVIFQPSAAHLFKLVVGDATKLPPIREEFHKSERMRSAELNYMFSDDDLLLNLSIFQNSLNRLLVDTLVFLPNGDVDISLQALGKVRTVGFEALARRSFGDRWTAELGGTYQDSDDYRHPARIASYSPRLAMHGKLIYKDRDVSVAAVGRYIGSMHPFYDVAFENADESLGAFIGERVDGYVVFDLNLRLENLFGPLFGNLRLSNVFDKQIRYPNNPTNTGDFDQGAIGPGRALELTMGYRF